MVHHDELLQLDELYAILDSLDVNEPADRQKYIATASGIIAIEASMIIDTPVHSADKIAILAEIFSESLLGVLKTWLIINPDIHPNKLVTDLCQEIKLRLVDWFPMDRKDMWLN